MIIQTGMRTDIPAFYSQWLLNRIREGFVLVRNPYHPEQVTRYSLSPDVVDLIAFCTKNPAPMLPVLEACQAQGTAHEQSSFAACSRTAHEQSSFAACSRTAHEQSSFAACSRTAHEQSSFAACSRTIPCESAIPRSASRLGLSSSQAALLVDSSYWFVTITPYGKDIEPNVPPTEQVMEDFKRLSDLVGVDSVGWRYDPIFLDDRHSVDWHIAAFEYMAETLSGYTKTCVISFIDIYKKVERNFPGVRAVSREDRLIIGREFIRIADRHGMTIRPCAEGDELAAYGADCTGCMTVNTFETALHSHLNVPKRRTNQRNGQCACLLGVDIGAYDTCGHLCRYCYANANAKLVQENMKKHDPASPFLLGHSMPQDMIHEAKQTSWLDGQICLDLS